MLLTLPVTTIITILMGFIKVLGSAGFVIYYGYKLTDAGFKNIRSEISLNLIERCSMLAQMLQGADKSLLTNEFGRKLIQKLVNAMLWAQKYDEKSTLSKFLFSSSYIMVFNNYHTAITRDLIDLGSYLNISKNNTVPKTISNTIDNIAKNTPYQRYECPHCIRKTTSCPNFKNYQ